MHLKGTVLGIPDAIGEGLWRFGSKIRKIQTNQPPNVQLFLRR